MPDPTHDIPRTSKAQLGSVAPLVLDLQTLVTAYSGSMAEADALRVALTTARRQIQLLAAQLQAFQAAEAARAADSEVNLGVPTEEP